jgi:hypothetical protein
VSACALEVSQLSTQELWSGLVIVSGLPDLYEKRKASRALSQKNLSGFIKQNACLPVP